MLRFQGKKGVEFCDGLTRRDFLRVGALGAGSVGLTLADLHRASAGRPDRDINCIILFLVGGPSQLDTWDLKPDAVDSVRGPFQPIKTSVPGVEISEHFPRMAQLADRYALIRSVHHNTAPIHETGHQLMQTGYLFRGGQEYPHYGSTLSRLKGQRTDAPPPFVVLPAPIRNTGVSVSHGQTAGYLGDDHEPFFLHADGSDLVAGAIDPARLSHRAALVDTVDGAQRVFDAAAKNRARDSASERAFDLLFTPRAKKAFDLAAEKDEVRDRYGRTTFGQSCLLARRLIEHGTRLVTVNMFDTVFNEITWDCHADGGSLASNLNDYKETLCPMFDGTYTALLDDLHRRGLLDSTLVVAMGEFGRTPQLNPRGGRDHWPGVWSVLFAGAGVQGGQVIGASDHNGAEPRDRPVTPAEIAASVYHGLGFDLNSARLPGPENQLLPLAEASPVMELFRG
jgi:uncharacterized protein (DUF1501 family)